MSRAKLEREYIFLSVIATFLRAIRAGAVHFRHTATLLAHYGRLGPSFDLCVKVIVDILREEGMYKDNGEAVVAIILQALRDVRPLLTTAAHTTTNVTRSRSCSTSTASCAPQTTPSRSASSARPVSSSAARSCPSCAGWTARTS